MEGNAGVILFEESSRRLDIIKSKKTEAFGSTIVLIANHTNIFEGPDVVVPIEFVFDLYSNATSLSLSYNSHKKGFSESYAGRLGRDVMLVIGRGEGDANVVFAHIVWKPFHMYLPTGRSTVVW